MTEKLKEIPEKLVEKIKEIIKPKPPEEIKPSEEIPIGELVPKEAPLAFQGKWQLLPSKPIREFVLAPLLIVFVLAFFLLYNFYRDKIDRIKK